MLSLMENFFHPSSEAEPSLQIGKYRDIRGYHQKTFSLLDDNEITVRIILYTSKLDSLNSENENSDSNGIVIITEEGDLVAENISVNENADKTVTNEQVETFKELTALDNFLDFADRVNALGNKAGTLRFEL